MEKKIVFRFDRALNIPETYRQEAYADCIEMLVPYEVEGAGVRESHRLTDAEVEKAFYADPGAQGQSSYGMLRWKGRAELLKVYTGYRMVRIKDRTCLCD